MIDAQRGVSALAMVLILLLTGGMMLNGLHQQLTGDLRNAASEVSAIRQFSLALSAQSWATQQRWVLNNNWQCQQDNQRHWRACVRPEKDSLTELTQKENPPVRKVVLMAYGLEEQIPPVVLWRKAQLTGTTLQFVPRGWSDFCPFQEKTLCALPAAG